MQSKFSLGREERIIRRVRGASVISIGCHEFFSFFLAANILKIRFELVLVASWYRLEFVPEGKKEEGRKLSKDLLPKSVEVLFDLELSRTLTELAIGSGVVPHCGVHLPLPSLSLCLLSFRTATLLCERASTANVPRPLRYFHRVIRRKNSCLRIVFQRTKTKSMGRWIRAFYFPNLNRDIFLQMCLEREEEEASCSTILEFEILF